MIVAIIINELSLEVVKRYLLETNKEMYLEIKLFRFNN